MPAWRRQYPLGQESAFIRRLVIAKIQSPDDQAKFTDLMQRIAAAAKASDEYLTEARQHINAQIADPLDFDDNVQLARMDTNIGFIQELRQEYEDVYSQVLKEAKAEGATPDSIRPR